MNILERIAQARDSDMIDIRTADGQIDAFPVTALKDLVASHAELLETAEEMHDNLALQWQDEEYQDVFNRAKILATVPEGL